MSRQALGRGLDALLPTSDDNAALELAIEDIQPNPFQPRQTFETQELEELASSIKTHGLLQPIVVRKVDKGYQIIMGERRWRAAQLAELTKIPAVVREASDDLVLVMALVENVQRADLNPIDQASAYKRLADDFGLTQEQIADLVGKDRSTIANFVRLLDLPKSVQLLVREGTLSAGHARTLLAIPSASVRHTLAKQAIETDMSVRELERAIKQIKKEKKERPAIDRNIQALEEKLSLHFSTRVAVQHTGRKGKIMLSFFSLEDLDRLLDMLFKVETDAEG